MERFKYGNTQTFDLWGAWTAAWLFAEVQRWPAEGHCTIASNATEMAMRSGDSARSGAQLIDMPR